MKADISRKKVHIISMGCAKNLVDTEKLMAQVSGGGMVLTDSIENADVAVINTCGFIEPAKQESIDVIMQVVKEKAAGKVGKVFAMGCLTERYRNELAGEIPELDGIFGSNDLENVLRSLGCDLKYDLLGERVLTTPRHSAYLKISEGCDNPCSFCAIPLMRGRHVSRPLSDILVEVQSLAGHGTRELVIIGQDTTFYGVDRSGDRQVSTLLQKISEVGGIEWIRLMYAYPAKFPMDLLEVIRENPRVCRYLDMPVQHCSDPVLRSMRRGISSRALHSLIDTVRDQVPDIALRTTLIVGYPSETPKEFEELIRFVEQVRFSRLGVFTYSREDDTHAFPLGDPVPDKEKERRKELIMELQKEISETDNQKRVGTRQRILVDRKDGELTVGRTERDAPEIDNEVYVRDADGVTPGEFIDVDILDSSEYDLYGVQSAVTTGVR